MLSDTKTFFSKEYGWPAGMGDRNGRWAMIFDNGKVVYAENEKSPGEVSVSLTLMECMNEAVSDLICRFLAPKLFLPSSKSRFGCATLSRAILISG